MRPLTLLRGAVALLAFTAFLGLGEARAQTDSTSSYGTSWVIYEPGSSWTGYTVGTNPVTYAPTTPAPVVTTVTAPSGWSGYTAPNAWAYYAPQQAWAGYVPQGGWYGEEAPYRGYGTVNGEVTAAYHEFGSGRPVALAKPWLPGSP